MTGGFFHRLEFVDRRWLFVILSLAIMLPLLFPVSLPIPISPMVRDLYDAVEALPEGSIVLVSADYDPPGKPELLPFHIAVLHHLAEKRIRMVMVSLWAPAPPITERVLEEVGLESEYGYVPGVDYVHLGYKEGRQIVIRSMGKSIHEAFPFDRDGTPVDSLPLMREVFRYDDVEMLINVSAGVPGIKEYVQIARSQYGVRIGGACTAVSGPDYVPYYQAIPKQLVGLSAGMKGAAEYELLVGRPGEAVGGMAAQSASHVLIIVFILFGNVMYFLRRRRES
ncbi:MAG: hypothetical protein QF819_03955 [Gemmatimonadota bacterium]|jgi:hypothetical protein|nr:hypothetical protein [Gemmatimonadota bacterium]MDP6802317.1 hypothetical protein [Gemmatimonadota bacterium]MDP7031949.1 hypothetical protein [Gemmatimonadota bacterium]